MARKYTWAWCRKLALAGPIRLAAGPIRFEKNSVRDLRATARRDGICRPLALRTQLSAVDDQNKF